LFFFGGVDDDSADAAGALFGMGVGGEGGGPGDVAMVTGLEVLRVSVNIHLVPEKTLRRAKNRRRLSYSERGIVFSATEAGS